MTDYKNMIEINGIELYHFKKLCKSVDKDRYYLRGVYIEPHATDKEAVTLTATNGHILCHKVIKGVRASGYDFEPFILGLHTFEKLRKSDAKKALVQITLKEQLVIDGAGMTQTVTNFAVDDTYPNYRGVTPKKIEPNGDALKVIRIKADLLKLLQDTMQYDGVQIDFRKVYDPQVIRPNPEAPEYDLGEYALIMPMNLYKDKK